MGISLADLYKKADFDSVDSGGDAFDPPDGFEAHVAVVWAKAVETKKGYPGWRFSVKVLDEDSDYYGQTFFSGLYLSNSEVGNGLTFSALSAFGMDEKFFSRNRDPEDVAAALVGREAHAKVRHKGTYTDKNGNDRPNINVRWSPVEGTSSATTLDEDDDDEELEL